VAHVEQFRMIAGIPSAARNIIAADGGGGGRATGYGYRRQVVNRHAIFSPAHRCAQFPEETGKYALIDMRDFGCSVFGAASDAYFPAPDARTRPRRAVCCGHRGSIFPRSKVSRFRYCGASCRAVQICGTNCKYMQRYCRYLQTSARIEKHPQLPSIIRK